MSHQTGIQANDDLLKFFGKCKDGQVRAFKVSIQNEQLTLDEFKETAGSWTDDFSKFVPQLVEDKQPSYVFFRLDTHNETGFEWVFICWSPDNSPVREKMLYASTKATLKKEFGGAQIKEEMFATTKAEASLSGYEKHIQSQGGPAPLTFAEEELKHIKKAECGVEIGVDSKSQTIQGLAFPISDAAVGALFDLKERKITYVQLSIDMSKEEINLEAPEHSGCSTVQNLQRRIPTENARYHLFYFPHSYEGDQFHSIVFIYSMPGYTISVKERMLYSSCKSPLLESIENKIGLEVAKKIEIDDPKELTEEFLIDQIHPKLNIYKQKFSKPKGPTNRGARRLIKTPQETGV